METPETKRRRLNRERQQRWRNRQSQVPGKILSKLRQSFRENESENLISNRNRKNAQRMSALRANESENETQARRLNDALQKADHRRHESDEESQIRRSNQLIRHSIRMTQLSENIVQDAVNFDESEFIQHYCGELNVLCQYCGSKNFLEERPRDGKFTSCCRKGKIKLEKPTDINGNTLEFPQFIKDLISNPSNQHFKNFRDNIRNYNSALSFASMGAKVANNMGRGPNIFRVHGQICHRTSHMQPRTDENPQFNQLYVIDSTQANEFRLNNPANERCLSILLSSIDRFFREHNRLSQTFKLLREVESRAIEEALNIGLSLPVVNLVFRRDRHADKNRYNSPNSNEIAMVFVNNDGEPPFERDIRIYPKNPENSQQPFININILSPNLEPMTYPLLFPFGQPGWQPNWTCESYEGVQTNPVRNNITKLQYVVAQTAIRDSFNPCISFGKLTQQWLVDSYLQIEANNLNFIKQNQKKLRSEIYQGLVDHLDKVSENFGVKAGVPTILPSSFEGTPRNMKERCVDAMSIFSKYGPPDLFITFTANPKWREITENLKEYEMTNDRPDLVARVFKLKLKSLIKDLTVHHIFGRVVAYVYSIEFQKRGLPHAHILLTLQDTDKFTNTERIDSIVSAEIPNFVENPLLYEIVSKTMIHGPCGEKNLNSPCMEFGKCKKQFPKDFQENTLKNNKGYPVYRRRSGATFFVRGTEMDNRFVVPYNPYLIMKYQAHINVEICTSLKSVKYIYKYIYKGYDCATMKVTSNESLTIEHNEVKNYIDCRYVSAPEAMWRLLESKMHDRSHVIIRLPVHLPNQQRILFNEGFEQEALDSALSGKTKLESWFELNRNDINANQYLYSEIPYHYVYVKNSWQIRKRGSEKIVPRIYTVSIKDQERFYLRMLLLHIPGATSYEYLKSVDGIVYATFKEAAFHRHLLESDKEWDDCLLESATYEMPKQMRQSFAFICIFCSPSKPIELWEKFCYDLSMDYAQSYYEDDAKNYALHDINSILQQHGLNCSKIGLPTPTGSRLEEQRYDIIEERNLSVNKIASLNQMQLNAFSQIIEAIDTDSSNLNKLFYLDGPGGSGKTYLYSTLLSFIRGRNQTALPFATTGIAATLLKGGKTVHSGFKLPIPLTETSMSSMRMNSEEASILKEAKLIIIDEVSMLTKYGLSAINKLFKDIMLNSDLFGGKVIVLGGDFRQTLPVVVGGTRVDIVEACIKSSCLWRHFKKITLTTNMRSNGDTNHNQWLLNIGEGNLSTVVNTPINSVIIPSKYLTENDIIEEVYGNYSTNMTPQEISKKVILATTNKETLQMNSIILNKMTGEPHNYYSVDSIISEDPNDYHNYPQEFLHTLTPSGMPPHHLKLKVGAPIMLLRNLNSKQGLCNGTRLVIRSLQQNFITAEILSECNKGDIVFIPRAELIPSDTNLPFTLKRRQFPIIPAYAITINKSQGQTYDRVGIYLNDPVFSHGQLYVALSRSKYPDQIKIYIRKCSTQGNLLQNSDVYTQNVVFNEVL